MKITTIHKKFQGYVYDWIFLKCKSFLRIEPGGKKLLGMIANRYFVVLHYWQRSTSIIILSLTVRQFVLFMIFPILGSLNLSYLLSTLIALIRVGRGGGCGLFKNLLVTAFKESSKVLLWYYESHTHEQYETVKKCNLLFKKYGIFDIFCYTFYV